MVGFATMKVNDLGSSLKLAHRLYDLKFTVDEELLQEAGVAMTSLAGKLELVPGVPTTVGSGRASLAAKLHCLVHSCKLTSKSWLECVSLLNSTCSWTGDLGTESGVSAARSDLRQLFGNWVTIEAGALPANDEHIDDDQGEGDEDFQFVAEHDIGAPHAVRRLDDFSPHDKYIIDWRPSIFVPGALHILHNITGDLSKSLREWPEFISSLRQVARFLARPWTKSRLLETCFNMPPHDQFATSYKGFSATVYEGRWGEALNAVNELIPLQRSLRNAWSIRKYSFGHVLDAAHGDDGDHHPEGGGVKMSVFDAAIQSDFFWGYANMVNAIGECILECMHWAEGCMCHDTPPGLMTRYQRVVAFKRRYQATLDSCPMKTRRSPEMANNAMLKLLRSLLSQANQLLAFVPSISALSDQQRGNVMRDFSRGRQFLMMMFSIKFGHWHQLPWVCMGIAHPDRAVAAASCQRSIDLFASASPRVKQHPVVQLLCDPTSPAHQEMVRFARGDVNLDVLPVLERMCGRFLFTPIAERWVESLHAALKKHLVAAPHYSAVHVAWRGIQNKLNVMFADRPQMLAEFADMCNDVRNPRRALVHMGFWHHPDVQQKLAQAAGGVREFGRQLRPWVVQLLYHADSHTVFQDHYERGFSSLRLNILNFVVAVMPHNMLFHVGTYSV
jgi:hypothetical protein